MSVVAVVRLREDRGGRGPELVESDPALRGVQLVTDDPDAARCPACGRASTSVKEWVLTRPRDLAVGDRFTLTQWRKRRVDIVI